MTADEPAPPPHTEIRDGLLRVDGAPFFPFGGELQYFRVRDRGFDGPKTHALWAERLDRLRDAGLNLISTYVPWDYHATAAGTYDWTGPRDLNRFLELAAERGFRLIVKPGPFILAEWPHGFGSYGAVPLWWRRAHREALVRDRRGRVFRWHPIAPAIGRFRHTLPSYASADFRRAVCEWFEAVAQHFRDLIGPDGPVIGVQIDNETNLFWSDLYRIDHHPEALARYRTLLEVRYGTVDRLSAVYGRRFRSFETVEPPRHRADGPEVRHRDWIEHQQGLVSEYLAALRVMWERLGVCEPDTLLLVNDTAQTFPGRDLVLPRGKSKSTHGLYCVDTYPRGLPLPTDALFDTPYEPETASRLYGRWNQLYTGGESFSLGVEVQGGHFSIPLPVPLDLQVRPHTVLPEATRQTLLRLLAHGMKGIVVYTAVGGINLDGSDYGFQAALGLDGTEHPRLAELEHFARLLRRDDGAVARAETVTSSLGILASGYEVGPGHGRTGEQRIFGRVLRGLFGWAAAAGFTPTITDLELCDLDELRRYRALLFPSSGAIPKAGAALLERYVEEGGTLVQLLSPGPLRATLFPGQAAPARGGVVQWMSNALRQAPLLRRETALRFHVERAAGTFEAYVGDAPLLQLPQGAERVLYPADRHDVVAGYARAVGKGRAVYLTISPGDVYTNRSFYHRDPTDLQARALFLRRLLRPSGIRRLFACGAHEEAHALRDPDTGTLYVVVLSSREAATLRVRARAVAKLSLDPEKHYEAHDLMADGEEPPLLGQLTGQALREEGLQIALPKYGSTVVRIRPFDSSTPSTSSG